VKLLHYHFFIS